jgi:methylmalonyl-CoA/ethylmalonyl-CoA epimerase
MSFLFQVPGLAFFDCAGIRLMLSASETPGDPSRTVLYFRVPGMEAACQTLAGRGVIFESEPHVVARMPDHDLWMAFFRDPDRNLLALMSEALRPA